MYSLAGYGEMIADQVRIEAYYRALRKAIRPGSTVVDIGTGPGIMAVLACRLGAGRVFAIEPNEIVQVAREVAAANQCADKISFYEDLSTKVSLPDRVDVIVSDMRGILPLFERHIPSIVDARRRFLAPGGVMISRKDTIWAALVETPKDYAALVGPWDQNSLGQNLQPARRRVINSFRKAKVDAQQLLTKPQLWVTLDYAAIEHPDLQSELHWTVERAGTGHGILLWFEADLADGVSFSNAPGTPETIYGSLFFPWTQPIPLTPGQAVCVSLHANLLEDDYFWRWNTHVEPANGSAGGALDFEQSQLQGAVLSLAKLHKLASDHVPDISEDGRLCRKTLEMIDGKASLEQIARRLAAEFPARFAKWQQALSFAGAVSQKYSK